MERYTIEKALNTLRCRFEVNIVANANGDYIETTNSYSEYDFDAYVIDDLVVLMSEVGLYGMYSDYPFHALNLPVSEIGEPVLNEVNVMYYDNTGAARPVKINIPEKDEDDEWRDLML